VTFNAIAGTTYQIAVDGYNAASGNITLHLLGNRIDGIVSANLGNGHLPSIDVYMQRIASDSQGNPITNLAIQPNLQTWLVIHGRQVEKDMGVGASSMRSLAAAIDARPTGAEQVLVVDWTEGASDSTDGSVFHEWVGLNGAAWIPNVADWVTSVLTSIGITSDKLFLVGHSWGTFLAYEIANRVPGVLERIVALDPAREALDYDDEAVNFADVTQRAWAFYGNGLYGSEARAGTADEAFTIEYAGWPDGLISWGDAHAAPRHVFESLVRRNNTNPSDQRAAIFNLSRLETTPARPWRTNAYDQVFEGIFTLDDLDDDDRWGDAWAEVASFKYRDYSTGNVVTV
jgi:pimeloyl-ACP methyl ester carboxylesterase